MAVLIGPRCSARVPLWGHGGAILNDPDAFDAFYKETRTRLLVQTLALTGDLTAARGAVRDAYRHGLAPLAQGQPTRTIPKPGRARMPGTMLNVGQRRESGIATSSTRISARHSNRWASCPSNSARCCCSSNSPTSRCPTLLARSGSPTSGRRAICRSLEPSSRCIAAPLDHPFRNFCSRSMPWPRKPAGPGRRSCVAPAPPDDEPTPPSASSPPSPPLVVAGVIVSDGGTARPKLSQEQVSAGPEVIQIVEPPAPEPRLAPSRPAQPGAGEPTGPNATWGPAKTHDNTAGDGLVLPCQQARFADPAGLGALVRELHVHPRHARRTRATSATQFTELSADDAAAATTYKTTLGWYAGCVTPQGPVVDHREGRWCRRHGQPARPCDPGRIRSRRTPSASRRPVS